MHARAYLGLLRGLKVSARTGLNYKERVKGKRVVMRKNSSWVWQQLRRRKQEWVGTVGGWCWQLIGNRYVKRNLFFVANLRETVNWVSLRNVWKLDYSVDTLKNYISDYYCIVVVLNCFKLCMPFTYEEGYYL